MYFKHTYSLLFSLSVLLITTSCQTTNNVSAPSSPVKDLSDEAATVTTSSVIEEDLQPATLEEIRQATITLLPDFINRLNDQFIGQLGFKNRDEMENAAVGQAIPQLAVSIKNGEDFYTQHIWRLPLIVNGKMRTLVNVEKHGANYVISGMGGEEKAALIQELSTHYNDFFHGKQLYIIRSYQLTNDFLGTVEQNGHKISSQILPIEKFVNTKSAAPDTWATIRQIKEASKQNGVQQ